MSVQDPCYSPSQTARWLECRIARWLQYKEHWQPKAVGRPEMSALAGRAFATGMQTWYQARKAGNPTPIAHAQVLATREITAALAQFAAQGRTFNTQAEAMVPGLAGQVASALKKTCDLDPTAGMEIVAVEEPIPEAGYVRPDIVLRDSLGLAVGDFKLKLTLKPDYLESTLAEYRNSWQLLHGAWAVGRHYGEPCKTAYLFMVVNSPRFQVAVDSQVLDPEVLAWWEQSARTYWAQMYAEDVGTATPAMAAVHGSRFGPCPYQRACFDCKLDPGLMAAEYIQVKRDYKAEEAARATTHQS